MKKRISLNGEWLLKYAEYASGERFGLHSDIAPANWMPAQVPGDVHLDLMRAGIISDPFYGLESDHCIWMEEKDWWYRTTFSVPDKTSQHEMKHIYLLFHGLDTFATVYLNGEKIGAHSNMFIPLKLDITNLVKPGDNDLRICLSSPVYAPDFHRDAHVARTPPQRLFSRKAQSCYGWDITPRLVTIGIWRPVEIVICDDVEILDAWVHTSRLHGNQAEIELEFRLAVNDGGTHRVSVDIMLHDQKRSIELNLDSPTVRQKESFLLENPPLWWPYNHGTPNLLPYSIRIIEDDREIDRFEGKFGVRTVELIQKPFGDGRTLFYFEINGKPIFLKGMNWTPSDAIYARISEERTTQLVQKAVDSNINSLRVWGGGFYESDRFYQLCDEMGILVWQDFMFACGVYPQDEVFLEAVRDEADYIVRHLRGHPSIFLWCGDNEVDWVHLQENIPNYLDNKINRRLLPDICRKLDPTRPYIPSSPFSPDGGHPNNAACGNVHLWKHGSSYRDDFYSTCHPNMVTEIGHISLPNIDVLKSFIPEDKLWPPYNEFWYLHCSDPLRSGESYRVNSYFSSIAENGLARPADLEALIQLTQQLQVEATAFWIDHFSSQPDCWGIFLWNLCDCWPQISDAYIAYPFNEKPALKTVKEGYGKIGR